jgi:hypothetical protein
MRTDWRTSKVVHHDLRMWLARRNRQMIISKEHVAKNKTAKAYSIEETCRRKE